MPPGNSQKGTGKKGASAMARQRSRNTTPSSVPPTATSTATASLPQVETVDTEYLELKFEQLRNISYDDLVDSGTPSAFIPDSRSLDGIVTRLQRLLDLVESRTSNCDRGMRLLAANRKTRMDEIAAERGREDDRRRREADEEEKERRANKKKRKATESLAPQDSNLERSSPLRENSKVRKQSRDNDSTSSSLSPPAPATPSAMEVDGKAKAEEENGGSDSDSSDDGAPPPRPVPQNQTFGEDPSTFPDPTVYEIRDVTPGMTEEEIREIYSVAGYPASDLADMIAGEPPDKDFSNAKPSNQISFSTFSTYVEPYFRPFTEEDLAFLRERGDRVTPFHMPKRGKKHYTDTWAEEDGSMSIDSSPASGGRDKVPPNQARGIIDNMTDDIAETDKLSVGPLMSRLLAAMRPEARAAPPSEDRPPPGLNGDVSMNGGSGSGDISMNGTTSFVTPSADPFGDSIGSAGGFGGGGGSSSSIGGVGGVGDDKNQPPPATYMAESTQEAWKKGSGPKLDYNQMDERIKLELRHIGFLPLLDPANPPAASGDPSVADYDGAYDDEVAARLRLLQTRLRDQMLTNGARKARLTDLVKERMAHQEYQTILEDLDSQVQAAYLKRTRTMGKSKKGKRPGGAGGGSHAGGAASGGAAGAAGSGPGMARPGIGDMTRTLMERRKRWIENIGTVFDDEALGRVPRSTDPDSSIFKPVEMASLIKREKEAWDEEVDDE